MAPQCLKVWKFADDQKFRTNKIKINFSTLYLHGKDCTAIKVDLSPYTPELRNKIKNALNVCIGIKHECVVAWGKGKGNVCIFRIYDPRPYLNFKQGKGSYKCIVNMNTHVHVILWRSIEVIVSKTFSRLAF